MPKTYRLREHSHCIYVSLWPPSLPVKQCHLLASSQTQLGHLVENQVQNKHLHLIAQQKE